MRIEILTMESPLGALVWTEEDGALCDLEFADREEMLTARVAKRWPAGVTFERVPGRGEVAERLRAYFAGDLEAPRALAVAPRGTPFQRRVWEELRRIPPGRIASYGEIAAAIGAPLAARAVGAANAANPVAVVIPCHRVVRSDGSLSGYAGGREKKAWLLRHEGARPALL